jgi:KaiC/GvpD/RAD55 family RecA-like ATPase
MGILKKLTGNKDAPLAGPRTDIQMENDGTLSKQELSALTQEIKASGAADFKPTGKDAKRKIEILPTRVSEFDKLIERGGLERGSTILISGGAGSGKTTFILQSMYNACLKGEKAVYITLEEDPDKIKEHMYNNYGWDFEEFEKKKQFAFLKFDALEIARSVEAMILREREKLTIQFGSFELPFTPDRIAVDSLSALSIAFEKKENYRKYVRHLFERLEKYDSVNYFITETEQNPSVYSRAGIEEFLADGVIVLYNIKVGNSCRNVVEILKLRASKHEKCIIPYEIGKIGIELHADEKIF